MKTNHTVQTTDSFVYEPIPAEAPAVPVSDFMKLIARLMTEPKPTELPVII